MARENKDKEYYKQIGKRKEAMKVTFPMQDKKRRAPESYRSSERVPVKETKEQPNSRNMNRKGYEFSNEDIKEMYDELLKHDKTRPLANRRPKEAWMTNNR